MTATLTKKTTAKKTPAARKPKAPSKPLPTGLPLMIGLDKLAVDPMNVRPGGGDVGAVVT